MAFSLSRGPDILLGCGTLEYVSGPNMDLKKQGAKNRVIAIQEEKRQAKGRWKRHLVGKILKLP